MNGLKVEYLIIVNTYNSFCNSKRAFNNLLTSIGDIHILKNELKYNNSLKVNYEIQSESIGDDKQRFFHIKFTCVNTQKIEEFINLLRAIKDILYKATNSQPQVLWDDISFFYSHKAYPLIHDVENLMRKLITKFMLTNVGLGWVKEAIPQDIIKNARVKPTNVNYLQEIDFIQLATFLFKEYETIETQALLEKIKKTEKLEDLELTELKDFIPKSNWERYFSKIVDSDDGYLEKRWKKLYDYRCKIAHNKSFTKADYEETEKLYKEVKDKLEKAIDSLDKIQISEEDRELVAENIASKTNELYGVFINRWKKFNSDIFDILINNNDVIETSGPKFHYHHKSLERLRHNARMMLSLLKDHNLLDNKLYNEILHLNELRNVLVHQLDVKFSDDELAIQVNNLREINIELVRDINKRLSELREKKAAENNKA